MVEALVLMRVGSGEAMNFVKTVKQEIAKVKGVKKVYGLFGRCDFAVVVEAKTNEEMGNLVADRIRGIKGVVFTETLVIGSQDRRQIARASKTLHFIKEILPEKEQTLFTIEGTGFLRRLEMTAKGSQYAWITLIVDGLVCMKESFESLSKRGSHYITEFRLPIPHSAGEFSVEIDLQKSFFKNLELMITNTNSEDFSLKVKGTIHYDIYEPRFHFRKRKSPAG